MLHQSLKQGCEGVLSQMLVGPGLSFQQSMLCIRVAVADLNGTVQQYTSWTSSWETFYIKSLKAAFELEREVHGASEEMDELLLSL